MDKNNISSATCPKSIQLIALHKIVDLNKVRRDSVGSGN